MENRIDLKFKTLTDIAGNPFGREIYEEQIKNKINWNEKNIIVFPDYIESVSISFVQGLMGRIIEDIPKELKIRDEDKKKYFKDNFKLFSNDKDLQESLIDSINF